MVVSCAGRSKRATEGMWADGGPWLYLCRLLRLEDGDMDRESDNATSPSEKILKYLISLFY